MFFASDRKLIQHLILHLEADSAKDWAQDEVIERWLKLFRGGVLQERFLAGHYKTNAEHNKVSD